jgi:hypothetical protein
MNEKLKEKLIFINTITNVFLLLVLLLGGIVWADTNGVWTRAEDIIAGTFGADEGGGNFAFPADVEVKNNLDVKNNICLNGQCHNDWSQVCEQWVVNNSIN